MVLLGILAAGGLSLAQAEDLSLVERIKAHDQNLERRVVGLTRIRVSHPQFLSAAAGVMVSRQPVEWDCVSVCEYRGLVVQLEPGLGGAQLSSGWAMVLGERRKAERHYLSDVYVGYGIKGTLLRTWGEARRDLRDRTYAGIEGEFTVARGNFSLGLLRNLSDGREDDRWLITAGMGWGF